MLCRRRYVVDDDWKVIPKTFLGETELQFGFSGLRATVMDSHGASFVLKWLYIDGPGDECKGDQHPPQPPKPPSASMSGKSAATAKKSNAEVPPPALPLKRAPRKEAESPPVSLDVPYASQTQATSVKTRRSQKAKHTLFSVQQQAAEAADEIADAMDKKPGPLVVKRRRQQRDAETSFLPPPPATA